MNISLNLGSNTHWSHFTRFLNSSVTPWSARILAASTGVIVGLTAYRWNHSSSLSKAAQDDQTFKDAKERVNRAYGYVFGGFVLTAAAAVVSHISGISTKILQNPYLTIPLALGYCAAIAATAWIDKKNTKAKHVAWGIFNISMGMMLSPLGYINQKVVAQAAAISLGLGGVLTLAAFLAPDRRFLTWEGPLMATLTGISIASTIALFFPGSAAAYGMDRVSLYGGVIVFSGLLMSSTQRLMEEAENQNNQDFDPIKSSLNIYLDWMNIFIRILRMRLEEEDNS